MSAATYFDNGLRRRQENHPNQTALTPAYVLDPVRAMLGGQIDLDPCTTQDNPVGATTFYAPPMDGCAEPWEARTVWVNPPYGEARHRWVDRCIETGRAGSVVVLLMPAATDTRVFQRAAASATSVLLIRGRLKFGMPRANGRQVAASHPSALLAWNADLTECAGLGLVVKGGGRNG